jgi:hypothetical protein
VLAGWVSRAPLHAVRMHLHTGRDRVVAGLDVRRQVLLPRAGRRGLLQQLRKRNHLIHATLVLVLAIGVEQRRQRRLLLLVRSALQQRLGITSWTDNRNSQDVEKSWISLIGPVSASHFFFLRDTGSAARVHVVRLQEPRPSRWCTRTQSAAR